MPLPAVAGLAGQEIGRALVLDALWEAQQHPHVVVGGLGRVRRAGDSVGDIGDRGDGAIGAVTVPPHEKGIAVSVGNFLQERKG